MRMKDELKRENTLQRQTIADLSEKVHRAEDRLKELSEENKHIKHERASREIWATEISGE